MAELLGRCCHLELTVLKPAQADLLKGFNEADPIAREVKSKTREILASGKPAKGKRRGNGRPAAGH